ncbi:hypothetical protein J2X69_003665 [Algoriphagus sp. 4150]|nr:hypothetical protein [Algoriphagus sp. 4150]
MPELCSGFFDESHSYSGEKDVDKKLLQVPKLAIILTTRSFRMILPHINYVLKLSDWVYLNFLLN